MVIFMKFIRLVYQIAILCVIYQAGVYLVVSFKLPLPGNVIGLILFFVLLKTGIIKPVYVQEGVNLLLKHFAFFFVPISVGLMEWGGLFISKGPALLTALVISAIIALIFTGVPVQFLAKRLETK